MTVLLYFGLIFALGGTWLAWHPRSALTVATHVRRFPVPRRPRAATRWSGAAIAALGVALAITGLLLHR